MDEQLINDSIWTTINLLLLVVFAAGFIYLFVLLIKALKKYISSAPVRTEKKEMIQSLGETLKQYRTTNNMTQEFVAEAIGVSRTDSLHDKRIDYLDSSSNSLIGVPLY